MLVDWRFSQYQLIILTRWLLMQFSSCGQRPTPKTWDLWTKKPSKSEHDEAAWRPYDLNHHLVAQWEAECSRVKHMSMPARTHTHTLDSLWAHRLNLRRCGSLRPWTEAFALFSASKSMSTTGSLSTWPELNLSKLNFFVVMTREFTNKKFNYR